MRAALEPALFALISSATFNVWQHTVGGRLKSDLRFSNTIVWNNFPVPTLTGDARAAIIAAGHGIESARAQQPDRSLAAHYDSMSAALTDAHASLDALVDSAFRVNTHVADLTAERQHVLFKRYAQLQSL